MSWYVPFIMTFTMIFLAELGDKTQLITISLSSKHPRLPVFLGVFLGMSLVSVMGLLVGAALMEFVPITHVKVISGAIFILFGVWTLLGEEGDEEGEDEHKEEGNKENRSVFTLSFIMISIAEFGDKTQLAVIALTAQYGAPLMVYLGAVSAFALIVGIGVVLGKKISERVSSEWIEIGAGIVFMVMGVLFILEALFF